MFIINRSQTLANHETHSELYNCTPVSLNDINMNDLETDALGVGPQCTDRLLLKKIDEQLMKRDINSIKFLCRDWLIPEVELETIKRGIDLFSFFEKRAKGKDFIAECMYRIQRADLLKKLGYTTAQFVNILKTKGSEFPRFRLLLQEICDEVTKREVDSMTFIASAYVPKNKLDNGSDPQTFFVALEQTGVIAEDDVEVLLDIVSSIERGDLVGKVQDYKKSLITGENKGFIEAKGKDGKLQIVDLPYSRPPPVPDAARQIGPTANVPPGNNLLPQEGRQTSVNLSGRAAQADLYARHGDQPNINISVGANEACIAAAAAGTPHPHPHPQNPLPTQNDGFRQQQQQVQAQFERMRIQQQEDMEMPSYRMAARPRGMCIIINNETFYKVEGDSNSKAMPDRVGSQVDSRNLQYIFTKLDFEVRVFENLKETEISRLMIDIAYNINHERFDCFACCILSHGIHGSIYGANGKLIAIKDLTSCFKANMCQSLAGKPKLFFIQACQGKDKQEGHQYEEDSPVAQRQVETIPSEADFLLGYATVPGFVSYRSRQHGSWYVTKLVEMLDRYAERYDLMSIMIKVNEEVSKANANINGGIYKQSPAPMATLRKKIYF